jgi:hypothetical protein
MNFLNTATQAYFVFAACCTPSAAGSSQPEPMTSKSTAPATTPPAQVRA